jgi:hypothetical protein
MASSPQLFLIVPLETEPDQIPENARLVCADSIEILTQAQQLTDLASQVVRHKVSLTAFRQFVRSLTE